MARADQTYIQKLTTKFLRAAKQQGSGNMRGLGGVLLGGDPGIGKTTFVELFSDLTGIHLITIEIPHIVEEHIINIPFLVYNPDDGSKTAGRSELHDKNPNNKDEYDMVLADSHLFTQITNSRTMPDQQYLQRMTDPNPNNNRARIAQDLFQRLGGNETTVPPAIAAVRKNFRCILFFDEYFREAPVRIRNILRDTINGNLGIHKIPSGTFIVYASNMSDAGLESIPKNTQMAQRIEFQTPSKKEWFAWLETKYKNDPKVELKPEVLEAFKKIVDDGDLSTDDVKSEVRTSPRRWEQLVVYINQSLPVADSKDAKALLTNVKNNFVNYETGEHAEELSKKVMKMVAELVKSTSNVAINANETSEGEDWTENLDHHIRQTMKSGKHRKYIPVISGAPGVGKTSQIDRMARKHNLIAVPIDTSRLNPEDVIGMPIPGQRSEDQQEIKVKFTVPQLYDEIRREIKSATKDHFEALIEQHGEENAKGEFQKWEDQEWKYLIFFDELNRVDKKTFNSLRRIILEKNFGPSSDDSGGVLSLPDGSVVVGAVNPSQDTGGTESMTGHFRDVIDIINATPSWDKTRNFLLNRGNKGISPESIDATMLILDEFVKKFGDKTGKHSKNQAPYFLSVGDGEAIYVSPREYESLFSNMASALDDVADEILSDPDMSTSEAKEIISDEVGEYLESGLMFPVEKTETIAPEEFIALVKDWADTLVNKVFSVLISKKVKTQSSWGTVLEPYMSGKKDMSSMPNDSKINTAMNETSLGQFIEHVSDELVSVLKDEGTLKKWVVDENSPKLALNNDQIEETGEQTSKLGSFIMGLLYTLQLHEYQYDRIAGVGKTLSRGVSTALKKVTGISDENRRDIMTAAVELRSDIQDALTEIRDESE